MSPGTKARLESVEELREVEKVDTTNKDKYFVNILLRKEREFGQERIENICFICLFVCFTE